METIQYSEDARHYISLIHNTINRMAGNSANCKAWLIALITACLTFSHGVLLSNFSIKHCIGIAILQKIIWELFS